MSEKHSQIFEKVKQIEFQAKKSVLDTFSGLYASAFRGPGLELEDIREFQNGDDLRAISWAKTAQMGRPFVKTFCEERDLIVMLVADVSGSISFGGGFETKRERLAEVGALLAFSAIHNHDRVGLLLYSDRIEKLILPKRGMRSGARVIRELLAFEPQRTGTNTALALDTLNKVLPKRAITFLLSDFIDTGFERELALAAKKDDLIAIYLMDQYEKRLPAKGLWRFQDIESRKSWFVDVTETTQKMYESQMQEISDNTRAFLRKSKCDVIEIDTKESFLEKIITYFTLRKKYQK